MTAKDTRPHVVIVGGGFAGLEAAKSLRFTNVRVTLVDRQNHHLFQPLLYQVATAALSAPDIAAPIRKVLSRQDNTTVLMGTVDGFDLDERKVFLTEDGELDYDYLIVAAGMENFYFGNEEWEELAPGLKTIDDALEIRRRVLLAFERAERETDPGLQQEFLNFVVVGAGPTGVELAGALREIAMHTLARDFRHFDPSRTNVYLVEGQDEVLPMFQVGELREKAREQLEELGVVVRTGVMADEITSDHVKLSDGDVIRTRTVLWAAGVKAVELGERLSDDTDRAGCVPVEDDLSLPGRPEVFVVGDLANIEDEDGKPVPKLAPAATQMGQHAAINIKLLNRDEETRTFDYRDRGIMATIGRSRAIAASGPLRFSGFIAWLMWLFIHILFLIGFRNRVAVLLEWAWAYTTYQRSARVIAARDVDALPPAESRRGQRLPSETSAPSDVNGFDTPQREE